MQSVVIAIGEPYREWIEEAAGEIAAVTGRKGLSPHRPHVTLHVAGLYDGDVTPALSRMARLASKLDLVTGRVGIVRGPRIVVALEVVRDRALVAFHQQALAMLAPLARTARPAYATDTWAPHITIVDSAIDPAHADAIGAVLARRDFSWRIPVTNICLVPGPSAVEWTRFDVQR